MKELTTAHGMITTRIPFRMQNTGMHKSRAPNDWETAAPRVFINGNFMGNAITYNTAFCVAGDAGEKWPSIQFEIWNFCLKYFIHALLFRWPSRKLLWPPNFPSFSCGFLEILCGPLGGGGIWSVLRTTPLKYSSYQTTSKPCHVLQNKEILLPAFIVH